MSSTLRLPLRLAGTLLMQARTVWPFTSISQAPQLPPMQPVGIRTPAAWAASSQLVPLVARLLLPSGHWISTSDGVGAADGLED